MTFIVAQRRQGFPKSSELAITGGMQVRDFMFKLEVGGVA